MKLSKICQPPDSKFSSKVQADQVKDNQILHRLVMTTFTGVLSSVVVGVAHPLQSQAFVISGNSGLSGGLRWDAAPRIIEGWERSLDGGLRYSLQGGSFEAYRDEFTWDIVPTTLDFQQAIEDAFNAWTVVDPVSGLGTSLSFVADLTTAVDPNISGNVRLGAEIDLFATDLVDSVTRGVTSVKAINDLVTLTSGTENYLGSGAISGADIAINKNSGAVYNLDLFRRLLTHELGHAIGLGDVEGDINPNAFIDDNYDGTNSATALATLTNPIAHLIDPLNPAASPLALFNVPDADPGVNTPGVDILMESTGLGIAPGNPVTNLMPLVNDDYAGRQFLYPVYSQSPQATSVPEPNSSLGFLALATVGVASTLKRKLKPSKSSEKKPANY